MKYLLIAILLIAGCENTVSTNLTNDKDFKIFVYGRNSQIEATLYQNGEELGSFVGVDTVGIWCNWGTVNVVEKYGKYDLIAKPYRVYELNNANAKEMTIRGTK